MPAKPSPARVAIGRAVRELRERRGLSQEGLAARAGLQRKTIYRLENARVDSSYTTLLRVAGALGVSVSAMLDHGEELEDRARGIARSE